MSLEGAIAVHRFGLGARPGEIEAASRDPKGWLVTQIGTGAEQPTAPDGSAFPASGILVRQEQDMIAARRAFKAGDTEAQKKQAGGRIRIFTDEMAGRFRLGFTTARPFAEHLVWFWTNHFTVSTTAGRTLNFAGAFEREAIRPYIADTFENMLLAVASHPAMLVYLNNVASIGPDSLAGARTGKGRNENLGRELMELYSLGVDGGYTQSDVIALANILTGWSLDPDAPSGFGFFPNRHEPGRQNLRGKTYGSDLKSGIQAVRDLAHDPHTARHIATKFATYFIADQPSPQSVARLEAVFKRTGGDLKALAVAAVEDPSAWTPAPAKMRSPVEYVAAGYRLLGLPRGDNEEQQIRAAMGSARAMGEFPMTASSPNGWPLVSEAWTGPDAVLNRIEWAKQVGMRMPANFNAAAVADAGMGPLLASATRTAMARAETQGDALALLISSPEFQRR
ncbi:MAG: DUF1800 domain-containing protein [Pseudomonadota bacterium]